MDRTAIRMAAAQGLEQAGQLQEAERAYRQVVEDDPGAHAAWHALGLLAHRAHQPQLALQCLEAAIAIDGDVALYHRNIGEMYRRQGLLEQAAAAGSQACRLAPGDLDAHYNLGLVRGDQRDYAKAIQCYRVALQLDPRHGLSWNNLGSALEQLQDAAGARQAYAHAVAIDARHAEAQNNLGALDSAAGHLEQARACFEAALAAQPDFIEAHYNLSSLKTYQPGDPHLAMLERLYDQRGRWPVQLRIRYGFALGKALEDCAEYDRAFAAYAEGNQLQHQRLAIDEARADAALASIVSTFDASYFLTRRAWRGAAPQGRRPIFIVGMPRSGTTLLEQILCSHGSVFGAGELVELSQAVARATGADLDTSFAERVHLLKEADLRRLGEDYLQRVWQRSPDSGFITDKMPANFFYLGLIHLALPGAKIIHAMRDPMDSCFSCYSRLFSDTMEFAYDQGTLGRYFQRYMTLMRHWEHVLPAGTVLDVVYEDLVADTEAQARRILDFVGLPWDPNCLEFHRNRRLVRTASVAQVRKPIYTSSVARWKHFARHLRPLFELVQAWRPADDVPPELQSAAVSSVEAAFARAAALQQAGQLQEAEGILLQILQVRADHAASLHLRGVVAWQLGRRQQAVELVEQAIAQAREVALFHSNLAEMRRQSGHLGAAIRHGERATRLAPTMASAWSNLGIAHFDGGDLAAAQACHEKALSLAPGAVQSLNNLGSIARARHDLDGAARWYREALRLQPDYLEALSNLGAVLVEDLRPDDAAPLLERALMLDPHHPEALCNLGLARLKQKRPADASTLLQRSLELRPGYPEAMIGLARVWHEQERSDDAAALLQACLDAHPDRADAWCQLGGVSQEMGAADRAEMAYGRALALDPDLGDALCGMANLRLEAGSLDQAERLLHQAIASDPRRLAARFHLIQARKVKSGDANLAALEAMLGDPRMRGRDDAISLHYALGKAYDDLQDWQRAFPHFLEGARLKRATLDYDPTSEAAIIRRLIALTPREYFASRQDAGDPSSLPIFVLGMPRSGTTLTEQILASHPDIHGAGELPDLLAIIQGMPPDGGARPSFPEFLRDSGAEQFSAWGREYVARLAAHAPGKLRVSDKMPINYLALGLIPLMLPNAKIIHVRRNPVDTCVSCFTRLFNRHQEATYDLRELGQHYANYARLMQHWHEVLPTGAFLELRYEDLVADMEGQARRMIDWVGLDWNEACLSFHQTARMVRTASLAQVRLPIYASSVDRWRHYQNFLGPLLEGLGEFGPG